jgi:hypothetical protein
MRNECSVENCVRLVFGHGYCNMHYKRWRKTGDPGPATTYIRTGCSVAECPEPHAALGFCQAHWGRFKRSGVIPETPIRRFGAPKAECPRLFCTKPVATKGLCTKHYSRAAWFKSYEKGFTWDSYDALWDSQKGMCAICSAELVWDAKSTHIDHCHDTSKVRGLLCSNCNQGLGSFRDSKDLLTKAVAYLDNF